LVFGVPAIFIYLIAEIGVSNLFINFVSAPEIGDLTHERASHYLFLLWGGMMVGRFIGSYIMRAVSADLVLGAASVGAFIVMMIATLTHGPIAMWALVSVGLFHSIMFPTIFTLGIRGRRREGSVITRLDPNGSSERRYRLPVRVSYETVDLRAAPLRWRALGYHRDFLIIQHSGCKGATCRRIRARNSPAPHCT
jgi:hypothetical protein